MARTVSVLPPSCPPSLLPSRPLATVALPLPESEGESESESARARALPLGIRHSVRWCSFFFLLSLELFPRCCCCDAACCRGRACRLHTVEFEWHSFCCVRRTVWKGARSLSLSVSPRPSLCLSLSLSLSVSLIVSLQEYFYRRVYLPDLAGWAALKGSCRTVAAGEARCCAATVILPRPHCRC